MQKKISIKNVLISVLIVLLLAVSASFGAIYMPKTQSASADDEIVISGVMTAEGIQKHAEIFGANHEKSGENIVALDSSYKGGNFEAGNSYYLAADVTLSETITVKGDVNLCLNGYKLSISKGDVSVIVVESGATLNIFDCCPGEGQCYDSRHIHNYKKYHAYDFNNANPDKHVTGGLITGAYCDKFGPDYSGIYLSGNLNMYGGIISGNDNYDNSTTGGGVHLTNGTFNMYSGSIAGNNSYSGGGVYLENGTFNMLGGLIYDNYVEGGTAGVEINSGTFNMSGYSKIVENSNGSSSDDGGGVNFNGDKFTMSGYALISGNESSSGNGGGVRVYSGDFEMKDNATISNNFISNGGGKGGGVYFKGGTFTMNDNAVISDNCAGFKDRYGAYAGWGGGVYIGNGTFIMNDNATISGNDSGSPLGVAGHDGGGVCFAGEKFVMYGGKIINNTTDASGEGLGGYGGGVCVSKGTFEMRGGLIADNEANSGGGVDVEQEGVFDLYDGQIARNNGSTGDGGGAIYVYKGKLHMYGGIIGGDSDADGNKGCDGGAIYHNSSHEFIMEGGKISHNKTSSTNGAVCLFNDFTMTGGEISYNDATATVNFTYGGGVYIDGGNFTMKGDSKIIGNITKGGGGGVYVNGNYFIMSGNALISGNTTTSGGGGVYVYADFTMSENAVISNNTSTNNHGGGIYLEEATLTIRDNAIIKNNNAGNIGGGIYSPYGTINMYGGEISGNTAGKDAGGVYTENMFKMEGGAISDNQAGGNGGGVYVQDGDWQITGGTISNNKASYSGGGLYIYSSSAEISGDIKIIGNKATFNGGGVYSESSITMSGGIISDNTATYSGGGVFCEQDFTMNSGTISNNEAGTDGGGVCVAAKIELGRNAIIQNNKAKKGGGVSFDDSGAQLTLNGGTISGNESTEKGGAIYAYGTGVITINTGTISDNKAQNGGGFYIEDEDGFKFTISNCTISGNEATEKGGAGYMKLSKSFTMTGGTISNNYAKEEGGIYFEDKPDTPFTPDGGTVSGNPDSTGGEIIKPTEEQKFSVTSTYNGEAQVIQLANLPYAAMDIKTTEGSTFDLATKTFYATNAGEYTMTVAPKDGDYRWTTSPAYEEITIATLKIEKAKVSVNWSVTEGTLFGVNGNTAKYMYDGMSPETAKAALKATAVGLFGQDTVIFTYNYTGANNNAGTAWTVSAVLDDKNYELVTDAVNFTISIVKRTVTINIIDNLPELTITAGGTVTLDSANNYAKYWQYASGSYDIVDSDLQYLTFVTPVTAKSAAGVYPLIALFAGDGAANYDITFVGDFSAADSFDPIGYGIYDGAAGIVTVKAADPTPTPDPEPTPTPDPEPTPTPVDPENPDEGEGPEIGALLVIMGLEFIVLICLVVALVLVNRRKV